MRGLLEDGMMEDLKKDLSSLINRPSLVGIGVDAGRGPVAKICLCDPHLVSFDQKSHRFELRIVAFVDGGVDSIGSLLEAEEKGSEEMSMG